MPSSVSTVVIRLWTPSNYAIVRAGVHDTEDDRGLTIFDPWVQPDQDTHSRRDREASIAIASYGAAFQYMRRQGHPIDGVSLPYIRWNLLQLGSCNIQAQADVSWVCTPFVSRRQVLIHINQDVEARRQQRGCLYVPMPSIHSDMSVRFSYALPCTSAIEHRLKQSGR